MRTLRLVAVTIACLFGGGVLLWRSFTQPLPRKEQLEKIDAVVAETTVGARNSRYADASFPVLRLVGRNEAFKYLDWFPNPEVISTEIKAGDQVAILSDTDRNVWIWEVRKDGKTVISYEDVYAAVRHNNRFDPYLGFALIAVGVFGSYRLVKSRAGV